MMERIKYRKANKADVPQVFELLKELAKAEKSTEYLANTAEQMAADFDCYEMLVAETDQKEIVGIAIYLFSYSSYFGKTLFLDALSVKSGFRKKGIGSELLRTVIQIGIENNCAKIRWQTLGWNKPAIELYKKVGVDFNPEVVNCELSIESAKKYLQDTGLDK
jgi:GNAT superfamily N-acetyltransferase